MQPELIFSLDAKKIFFASDFHLGAPNAELSRIREDAICRWLDGILPNAQAVFILGDVFDFWYEYKYTVPKGYIRFLAKLAQLTDSGIPVYLFTGNHDLWMKDYLVNEIGVSIYRAPIIIEINNERVMVGHGDGLGPGDYRYKFLKSVFTNKTCQWIFSRLHPNLAFYIAQLSSRRSRIQTAHNDEVFKGNEAEWLYLYAKNKEAQKWAKYFIFGHRHLHLDMELPLGGRYINLGEWIKERYFLEWSQSGYSVSAFQ